MHLIYSTFSNIDDAKKLSRELLELKLIKCSNIFSPVTSLYQWDEKICEEKETPTYFKVPTGKLEDFFQKAQELHPYDTPCFIEISLAQVSKKYLDWINHE